MEHPFQIKTDDGHLIYGTQRFREPRPDRVVIFIHGLTGHPNELIHWLGASFFNQHNFAAVRFELYGSRNMSRRFDQTTVTDHAKDLNSVKKFCQDQGYTNIYLVAHSLGGPVVLLSDTTDISAIALWDPTYKTKFLVETCSRFQERYDGHIIDWGIKHLWGTKMPEELVNFPSCGELVSKIRVPIKIITAENKDTDTNPEAYFDYANEPKAIAMISGASHCFIEEGAPDMLFNETLDWFSKFA